MTNVDRSPRNINMLSHRRQLWLIDHGACLYFHHDWRDYWNAAAHPLRRSAPMRCCVSPAAWLRLTSALKPKLTPDVINGIVSLIPDIWLKDGVPFDTPAETRARPTANGCSAGWRRRSFSSKRRRMPDQSSFDYAIVRIVPQVEREEFVNAGVILRCRERAVPGGTGDWIAPGCAPLRRPGPGDGAGRS